MELHQLHYLTVVAEEESFTAAAARLHVAQSGLSAQVAKLERELGVTLLERLPRGVRPTDAGTTVLAAARTALAAVDAVADAAAQHSGLLRGEVRLGTVRGGAMTVVLDPLADFRDAHPQVAVRLVEGDSEALCDEVRAGRLDLALVGWSGAPPSGLRTASVGEDDLVVVLPAGHPLARGRRPIGMDRLVEEPTLVLSRGTGARAAYETACAAAGVASPIAVESSEPAALVALARRGVGVAVLSRRTAAAHADDLPVRRLATAATSTLGVVTRDAPSPAAADLRARLLRAAGA